MLLASTWDMSGVPNGSDAGSGRGCPPPFSELAGGHSRGHPAAQGVARSSLDACKVFGILHQSLDLLSLCLAFSPSLFFSHSVSLSVVTLHVPGVMLVRAGGNVTYWVRAHSNDLIISVKTLSPNPVTS